MLTSRGLAFFLAVLLALAISLVTSTPSVALAGLTLLLWFLASWLLFQVRTIQAHGRLYVERRVADKRGPVKSLWVGRTFEVGARLCNKSQAALSFACIDERLPLGVERLDGTTQAEGPLAPAAPLEIGYRIRSHSPGSVRFEGLTVRMADFQGFFYRRVFIQDVRDFRVLPSLTAARGHFSTVKRHNLLPLSGAHRHPRPGTGSELLDLRDYLPGDPPKMIAWKASARRDRLMTKEFESEVPIRCTLFVDTSNSVRVGLPGKNTLTSLVNIVAAVAQANSAARDLTGLCLFDEFGVSYIKPARGQRHLLRIFEVLADAATLAPTTGETAVAQLLPLAHRLAEEVYPQLLEPQVNYFPNWLPLWAPQAAWTLRRPPIPQGTPLRRLKESARYCADVFRQGVMARLSAKARKHYRWRKQLSAILATRLGLGPGLLALLLEDDALFVVELQHFLSEHRVAFQLPLYGPGNEYLFAAPRKVEVLAAALRKAVARGRDNELFVLLADLLPISDRLDPLLAAVKMARARHHTVLVVCPQSADAAPALEMRRTFARLGVPVTGAFPDESIPLILDRLERLRALERGVR
jgi:uncharacterized protein (DUF58 family)